MAIYTTPIDRQADSNFRVGSGYKLYFFDAGTTNARDTYTDKKIRNFIYGFFYTIE